jgi:hypothetical protein
MGAKKGVIVYGFMIFCMHVSGLLVGARVGVRVVQLPWDLTTSFNRMRYCLTISSGSLSRI